MNISDFVFLLTTLPFLFLTFFIFLKRRDLRRFILILWAIGGLIGLLSERWYFQDYWVPHTLVGFGVLSPEDFLFGGSVVALAATLPIYILKLQKPKIPKKRALLICLGIAAVTFAAMEVGVAVGINSILVSYIIFGSIGAIGILWQRQLLRSALISAGILVAICIVWYAVVLGLIDPTYLDAHYLLDGTGWSIVFFGFLPLTEMIWYATWGMAAAVLPYLVSGQSPRTLSQSKNL